MQNATDPFNMQNAINQSGISCMNTESSYNIITGGPDNDALYGGNSKDTINGNAGNDELFRDGSDDTLNGNAGNDVITGGAEYDKIIGAQSDDTVHIKHGTIHLGDGSNNTIYG